MSEAELINFRPKSEDEHQEWSKEVEIVERCKQSGDDPDNADVRQSYREAAEEIETWWDDLSEEDREGWEHNMTKDAD